MYQLALQAILDVQERILGMQPHTFACLVIPFIVQVIILLVWGAKWRPPPE